jgi:hypothetical protein
VTQDDPGSSGFFKGAELSRLLILLAIVVTGWALVWKYIYFKQQPPPDPDPTPAAHRAAQARVEPDKAPEFESVTDWTPIGLRDMAAYDLLLKRARQTPAADLARQGHRNLLYTDLWERPASHRGVPIHLLGTARRVHSYESKKSPQGRIYEAWVSTSESQGNPYVCVFEDLPKGLPVGPDVSERVVFNGYFLKEMRYRAGNDVVRGAPVLIGKIGWTPATTAPERDRSVFWMALIVGVMFVISLFRWIHGLRRSLSAGARTQRASFIGRPAEEIAPDDLAQWVESVQDEESEPGEGRRSEDDPLR